MQWWLCPPSQGLKNLLLGWLGRAGCSLALVLARLACASEGLSNGCHGKHVSCTAGMHVGERACLRPLYWSLVIIAACMCRSCVGSLCALLPPPKKLRMSCSSGQLSWLQQQG